MYCQYVFKKLLEVLKFTEVVHSLWGPPNFPDTALWLPCLHTDVLLLNIYQAFALASLRNSLKRRDEGRDKGKEKNTHKTYTGPRIRLEKMILSPSGAWAFVESSPVPLFTIHGILSKVLANGDIPGKLNRGWGAGIAQLVVLGLAVHSVAGSILL